MNIVGREYKAMLDPMRFADLPAAVLGFWEELQDLAESTSVRTKGNPDEVKDRKIVFLDTPGLTLRRHGLVLRRRTAEHDEDEYTLKCRSEDRYIAAGTDVAAVKGSRHEEKLEEDIAPPFRCRFSHSHTVALSDNVPKSVEDAASIFPIVGRLEDDGRPLAASIPLSPVHRITADERVYTGAKLIFEGLGPGEQDEKASVALIIWSGGRTGRPLVSEFSFRIKDEGERFSRGLALAARSFFEAVQGHDWCRPGSVTKTEYVYRDTRGD